MTLTRTSPALGGATVMVSRTRGCLGPRATMAWQVMGFPAVGSDMVRGFLESFEIMFNHQGCNCNVTLCYHLLWGVAGEVLMATGQNFSV